MRFSVVRDDHQRVGTFISEILGSPPPIPPFSAVGIEIKGELVGGAIFTQYAPGEDVTITVASRSHFIRPAWVAAILDYPFAQLDLPRVSSEVKLHNNIAQRFNKRLGFQVEGLKRGPHPIICYGLTREDYYGLTQTSQAAEPARDGASSDQLQHQHGAGGHTP